MKHATTRCLCALALAAVTGSAIGQVQGDLRSKPGARPGAKPGAKPAHKTIDEMECLARDFLQLEKGLAANRAQDNVARAKSLIGVIREIEVSAPIVANGHSAEFTRVRGLAIHAAEEVASHAKAGNTEFAGIALERLRRSCIACHVTVRNKNEERAVFPAKGNTLWGRIAICDISGGKRENTNNVVVFLDRVAKGAQARAPTMYPKLSQQDQQFTPEVLPVVAGTKVRFPNDDRVFHNVFSLSRTDPFDLGLYGKGKSRDRDFKETGLLRIHCNIHPKMRASILVLENPFFSVTDETGLYVITWIPDGEYVLRTWHDLGGGGFCKVKLGGNTIVARDFALRETKRTLPHKNKFGKEYKRKY